MYGEDRLVEYDGQIYRWFYSNGYRGLRKVIDNRTDSSTSVMEHRLVYELSRGVKLDENTVVHHLNRNRADNRPENLIALSREDHSRLHYYEDCGEYSLDNPSPYRRTPDMVADLNFARKIDRIVAFGSKLFYRVGKTTKIYYPIIDGEIDYDSPMTENVAKGIKPHVAKTSERNHCVDCGKEIHSQSNRCRDCDAKHRTIVTDKITREELKELIQTKSNTEIARMYGVSDRAVCKWRVGFGLPSANEQHGWHRGGVSNDNNTTND